MRAASFVAIASVVTADPTDIIDPTGIIFDNATDLAIQMERSLEFEKEFFEGNYVSTAEVNGGNMAHCPQVCDEWCWATSATMAASVFGGSTNCGQSEAKVAGDRIGAQCDTSCSSRCNQGAGPDDIVRGIRLLSGKSYYSGGVLSQQQLDSALQAGPVSVLVNWNGGGGHAVAIESVSGGMYRGFNPWPPNQGKAINVQYSGLTNFEGRGRWTHTVYTSGGGPSPGPGPSPYPGPSPGPADQESAQNCAGWKNAGYCYQSSQYYPFMQQNCYHTCGFGAAEIVV